MRRLLILATLLLLAPLSVWAYTNIWSVNLGLNGSSNEYLSHSQTATLESTGAVTMSVWVNFSAFAASSGVTSEEIVAYDHNGTSNVGWTVFQDKCCSLSNERIGVLFKNETAVATWTPINITTGTWHHIVGTWNGTTGDTYLYVDGVVKGTATSTGTISYSGTGTLALGTNSGGGGVNVQFQGNMNDVRIWGRALSGSEVTSLYNSGLGSCSFSNGANLEGWWLTDTADGTDSSGNGLTLTANNSPTFQSSVPYTCTAASPSNFGTLTFFGWF